MDAEEGDENQQTKIFPMNRNRNTYLGNVNFYRFLSKMKNRMERGWLSTGRRRNSVRT